MQAIEASALQVAGRQVGLRWYRAGPASAGAVPLVYLHGGGWCVGSNDTHDTVLRHLAAASAMPVCGVDYALAPEHPFPAALEDLRAVVDMLLARHPRLVLAGDSAGANLVLVEAMRRRDAGAAEGIAALLLFYGVYAPMGEGGSCAAYGDGEFGLSIAAQRRYLGAYLPRPAGEDPRVFPLLGRLDGLPPAYLLAAELDLLFDDSVRLHHAMAAAGSRSVLRVCRGMNHGFLNHANALPAAAAALREAGAFASAA
jgi:acetyl esterase